MNLFLIIYTGHIVAGTVGPLPYSMETCRSTTAVLRAQRDAAMKTGKAPNTGRRLNVAERRRIGSLRFTCEYRHRAPLIGEEWT